MNTTIPDTSHEHLHVNVQSGCLSTVRIINYFPIIVHLSSADSQRQKISEWDVSHWIIVVVVVVVLVVTVSPIWDNFGRETKLDYVEILETFITCLILTLNV